MYFRPAAMLRYLTAILFLTAFASQTFQQAIIVVDYYANTAAYVKSCENKAKPQLRCKGKCQMMMKLQEEEKKSGQVPERKLENKNEVVSFKSFYPLLFLVTSVAHSFQPAINTGKEVKRARQLLRPPIC